MKIIKQYKLAIILLGLCIILMAFAFIPYYNNEYVECINKRDESHSKYSELVDKYNEYNDKYLDMVLRRGSKENTLTENEYADYLSEMEEAGEKAYEYLNQSETYFNENVNPCIQRSKEIKEKRDVIKMWLLLAAGLVLAGAVIAALISKFKTRKTNL